MPTQRYKLTIAYRGTRYHGWQRQLAVYTWKGPTPPPGCGIPTVQETLAGAIRHVVRHPVSLVGSSRTDAGVHAKGQVAHFDSERTQIPLDGLRRAINHQLPDDILVREMEAAPPEFDAIFDTLSKRYQYFVWNTPNRNAFISDLCWHRWQALDVGAMRAAAALVAGEHDFTSFVRPGHGRLSSVRTVRHCDVSALGPRIVIGIEGSGFLWNMVRIIVGTLVEVGLGKYTPEDIPKMLQARDRRAAGSTAPPQGLYLQWVKMQPRKCQMQPRKRGDAEEDAENTAN